MVCYRSQSVLTNTQTKVISLPERAGWSPEACKLGLALRAERPAVGGSGLYCWACALLMVEQALEWPVKETKSHRTVAPSRL